MNQDSMSRSIIWNQPKPPAVIVSALIALTLLLGACGGAPEPTATPASLPTPVATIAEATSEAVSPTPSGVSDAAVITSTELVTGTEVLTNINVSTNTVVLEQNLITTVITNTNMVSNVVQSTESSNASESSVTTATAQLTPEGSTGEAVVNVTITPLPPTVVVKNTSELSATATPRPTKTAQSSESQQLTGTAPVAVSTLFTGVTDAQGKSILASTLLDSKFLTSDGKVSGELEDLVVDMGSGQLLYLLLKYGGLLSAGETTVAVPLNALSLKQDGTFLLNIPPDHLEQFPKVEEDWPLAGSPNWDSDVRNFWDKEGFKVGFDPSVSGNRIRRIASWTGAPLDDIGLGAGTEKDAIVALDQGRVPYVLVSFANAPDVNGTDGDNNWYAVPLTAFDPQNPKVALRSDVNASTFEGAPRLNRDSLGQNPFLPANYDEDWQVFWKKLTTPNP